MQPIQQNFVVIAKHGDFSQHWPRDWLGRAYL